MGGSADALPAAANEPPKRLVGWSRVPLRGGESKDVTVNVSREYLSSNPDMPFADAVLVDGSTLYLSGRIGLIPGTTRVPDTPEEEVHLVMQEIQRILALAGMTTDNLVSLQIFASDVSLWERFNTVYRTYFTGKLPARAFLGSGPLLFGARFELQGVAVKDA